MLRTTAIALALLLPACTNFETAIEEFDSVTARGEDGREPGLLDYQSTARRYPWPIRAVEGTGVDVVLSRLFFIAPEEMEIANPAGFARDRLAALARLSAGHVQRMPATVTRLLWVVESDAYPLNQITALRGLQQILATLGGDPVQMVQPSADPDFDTRLTAWLAVYEAGWPGARGGEPLAGQLRETYRKVLSDLTALPLVRPQEQRNLIRSLGAALELEMDQELRGDTRESLLAAMRHGILMGFWRALRAQSQEVRECAMQVILRSSGDDGVAFLLAAIERPNTVLALGRSRYDDSESVRRFLVHACGQLTPELLERPFGNGPTPFEFLYDVIIERPSIPGLRMAAMESLCHVLRRELTFDPLDAREWWLDFIRRRRAS